MSARRPLKTRETKLAQELAQWLANAAITPNQISVFSVVFAILAAVCFVGYDYLPTKFHSLAMVFAAVFIQLRLLCNLLDGMVAIEGGQQSSTGDLFNEYPDRIADIIIILAAGFAIHHLPYAQTLAWLATILAVLIAYTRVLGQSLQQQADFCGPQAKPHRMALLTLGCLLTALEPLFTLASKALWLTLLLMVIGCVITLLRRTVHLYQFLKQQG